MRHTIEFYGIVKQFKQKLNYHYSNPCPNTGINAIPADQMCEHNYLPLKKHCEKSLELLENAKKDHLFTNKEILVSNEYSIDTEYNDIIFDTPVEIWKNTRIVPQVGMKIKSKIEDCIYEIANVVIDENDDNIIYQCQTNKIIKYEPSKDNNFKEEAKKEIQMNLDEANGILDSAKQLMNQHGVNSLGSLCLGDVVDYKNRTGYVSSQYIDDAIHDRVGFTLDGCRREVVYDKTPDNRYSPDRGLLDRIVKFFCE